jgi:flavin-dependent dehydrogenase
VFIGEGIDQAAISALLDDSLLSDQDMRQWEKVMKNKKLSREAKTKKLASIWEDGWEEWPAFEIEDEEELGKHRISEYLGHQQGLNRVHKHGHH